MKPITLPAATDPRGKSPAPPGRTMEAATDGHGTHAGLVRTDQSSGLDQPSGRGQSPDRRLRKKQATNDALIRAAMDLFQAKGYDQTSIHEITDRVDVSERTFFRYFASKEDLALSFVQDRMTVFARALAGRPPDEEPLVAARNAFHIAHRQSMNDDSGLPSYLSVIALIDSTPVLLAAHLRYIHEREDEIISVFAEREGVDPATDRRPALLAAMLGALVFLATRDCLDRDTQDAEEAVSAAFDAYAAELPAALSGHWAAAR